MDREQGFTDLPEEPDRDHAAHETAARLRYKIESGPNKHIRIVDHDPCVPHSIEADANLDSVRDRDRDRCRMRNLTRDRQNRDTRRAGPRARLDGDDEARARLA